jgi:hypothetical protein
MKITIMKGSTTKEGFYLKKDRSSSQPGAYDFWIGYKNDNGDVHEQRITELAYIILLSENKKSIGFITRKKY